MGGSKILHIVCVCTGRKFEDAYVYRLAAACRRHMPAGTQWDFTVLSDRTTLLLSKAFASIEAPAGLEGYWNKVALFQPDLFPAGDPVLYLDLDVLVTGPLIRVAYALPDPMVILWDPIVKTRWNSSVMMWKASDPRITYIWEEWNRQGRPTLAAVKHSKGDQAWIERCLREQVPLGSAIPSFWSDVTPGDVKPYYHKGKSAEYSTATDHTMGHGWYGLDRVGSASIVVFHGRPRFSETDLPMVMDHWR